MRRRRRVGQGDCTADREGRRAAVAAPPGQTRRAAKEGPGRAPSRHHHGGAIEEPPGKSQDKHHRARQPNGLDQPRQTAMRRPAAHGTEGCVGKGQAGDGGAKVSGVGNVCLPEHSRKGAPHKKAMEAFERLENDFNLKVHFAGEHNSFKSKKLYVKSDLRLIFLQNEPEIG